MDSKKLNLIIETGIDFKMTATLYDNNGNLIDLSGAAAEAHLRQYPEAADYFPFTVTHYGKVGMLTLKMPHDLTSMIPYSNGTYDVLVSFSDGTVSRPLEGEVKIIPTTTRN